MLSPNKTEEENTTVFDGEIWLPDPEWLRPMNTQDDEDEEEQETPDDGIWLPSPDWLRPLEEDTVEKDEENDEEETQ